MDKCAICWESLERDKEDSNLKTLACAHVYHDVCIETWAQVKKTCPVCRTRFGEETVISQQQQQHITTQVTPIPGGVSTVLYDTWGSFWGFGQLLDHEIVTSYYRSQDSWYLFDRVVALSAQYNRKAEEEKKERNKQKKRHFKKSNKPKHQQKTLGRRGQRMYNKVAASRKHGTKRR